MITRITQSEIDNIKKQVEYNGNVSICVGELSLAVKEKLQKQFKVTKEYFGYYRFEKLVSR
jgi:hypothetical protein